MSKNIIILSDGTRQDGGKGHDTNVYKLFKMVKNRSDKQVVFYDRGIGTDWRKITGSAFGMGISKNIRDCYRFIFENYHAGDNIYLFGFSRGATTVRSLSGFIHLFGILPKSRPELIKKAYKIYKIKNKGKREKKAQEFIKKHHTMWCKIKFLGVWDTVDALGIPIKTIDVIVDKIPVFKHRYHDLLLSKSVEHARHALAIDDERLTFHPKLWSGKIEDCQTMKQVWFVGMHTDVGGGYKEQSLSDITLQWMIREARQQGLQIYSEHKVKINPDPNGIMHDSRGGYLTRLYRKKPRSWNVKTHGNPVVHKSVLDRTLNKHNKPAPKYKSWVLEMDCGVEE